jgi:hypothetical protein
METKESKDGELENAFRKILNSHGYPFQQAVTKLAVETGAKPHESPWYFDVTEFPVSVNGFDTRIDLVLKRRDQGGYMIGECKRANPALSNWCFARVLNVRRRNNPMKLLVEGVRFYKQELLNGVFADMSDKIFHIGTEVTSNLKGDAKGSQGRGEIESAAGQVLKGVNGMVEYFSKHPATIGTTRIVHFVPVIFTTARLWSSEVNLSDAEIETGALNAETVTLKPEPWVWLNYNLSPALKHSIRNDAPPPGDLSGALEAEYTRSIAIVGANGLVDFLQRDWRFSYTAENF